MMCSFFLSPFSIFFCYDGGFRCACCLHVFASVCVCAPEGSEAHGSPKRLTYCRTVGPKCPQGSYFPQGSVFVPNLRYGEEGETVIGRCRRVQPYLRRYHWSWRNANMPYHVWCFFLQYMFIVPLPRHSACMEYMPTLTPQITPIYAYMARMERLGYDCRIVDCQIWNTLRLIVLQLPNSRRPSYLLSEDETFLRI